MDKKLKVEILNNKDDLIEGTFCYLLFEDGLFDEPLLIDLINKSNIFLKKNSNDKDVIDLLRWVVSGVEQCFLSNNDKNDLYVIKNYHIDMEKKWCNDWKPKIIKLTGHNLKS